MADELNPSKKRELPIGNVPSKPEVEDVLDLDEKPVSDETEPEIETEPEVESIDTDKETLEPTQEQEQVVSDNESLSVSSAPPPVQPPQKDEFTSQIETILQADLTDLFLALPEDKRFSFKAEGEKIAQQIRVLVDETVVKAKTIYELIKAWLKKLPGVNKFFLEQEAKIKTDRILFAAKQKHHV